MMEQILIILIAVDIGIFAALIGVVLGQHSVWKYLRKKGQITIGEWIYTGVKEGQYKYWD